ncbi:DUF1471 domain-containing protein, partial [Klebsiella pneumoniae]|nr:DUF1471 domain-containing protein [Klebsiella pneumoniae]
NPASYRVVRTKSYLFNKAAESMNKIGVVSAQGATTLDGLEAKLAAKAEAAGATGYSITSANTNNKLSGTAVIYK